MFINCPYCRALIATDPITDLPPTHCPQCMSLLRRDASVEDDNEPSPVDLGDLLATHASAETGETPETAHALLQENIQASMPDEITDGIETDALRGEETVADNVMIEAEDSETADAEAAPASPAAIVASAPAALPPDALPKRRSRNAPSFVLGAGNASASRPRERWLPIVAAMLALLLGLQWLLADRARLAADPQWRPVLNAVCRALRCALPPWREPAAFALLQRDVRQHPTVPGALRVSATFRNDARWSQPWPSLRLTLSDVNGRPAGERSFRAEEYLGGPPSQPELASGESATVAMDILEPAARIVAYDFSFR